MRGLTIRVGLLAATALAMSASARADAPQKFPVVIQGQRAQVWASSTLSNPKDPARYAAKNAFDGDIHTAWIEGAIGPGAPESLHAEFEKEVTARGFAIWPGYLRSYKTLYENTWPSAVILKRDGEPQQKLEVELFYAMDDRHAPPDHGGVPCETIADSSGNLGPRLVALAKPWSGSAFSLTINGIGRDAARNKFDDTGISEWTVVLDSPKDDWSTSPAIRRAMILLGKIARRESIKSSEWLAQGGAVESLTPFKAQRWQRDGGTASIAAINKYLKAHSSGSQSKDVLDAYFRITHDLWVPIDGQSERAAIGNVVVDSDGSIRVDGEPVSFSTPKGPTAYDVTIFLDRDGRIDSAGFSYVGSVGEQCDQMLP